MWRFFVQATPGAREWFEHDYRQSRRGSLQRGARLFQRAFFAEPRLPNCGERNSLHAGWKPADADQCGRLHRTHHDQQHACGQGSRLRTQPVAVAGSNAYLPDESGEQPPSPACAVARHRDEQSLRPDWNHGVQPAQHDQARRGLGTPRLGGVDSTGRQWRLSIGCGPARGRGRLHPRPLQLPAVQPARGEVLLPPLLSRRLRSGPVQLSDLSCFDPRAPTTRFTSGPE